MALNKKDVFAKFSRYRNKQTHPDDSETLPENLAPLTEDQLLRHFKRLDDEFIKVLQGGKSFKVLEGHNDYLQSKNSLKRLFSEMISRESCIELVIQHKVDERFTYLLKAEMRRAKDEYDRRQGVVWKEYEALLNRNKEFLSDLIKNFWKNFRPLEEPHLQNAPFRKIAAQLLVAIGNVSKMRAYKDKRFLAEARDLYQRAQKAFSYSECLKDQGDSFGFVYWLSRALATPEPPICLDDLQKEYDALKLRWDQHSAMNKVSSTQPTWYISFCLSFLRLQGIFFTGINTENISFLFSTFLSSFRNFIEKSPQEQEAQNVNLLCSMLHLWIFSAHHTYERILYADFDKLPELLDGDYGVFDERYLMEKPLCRTVLDFLYRFIEVVLEHVKKPDAGLLPVVVLFLYWLSSYRHLHTTLDERIIRALKSLEDSFTPLYFETPYIHLLLPEDIRTHGFLPYHNYFLSHKELNSEPCSSDHISTVRLATVVSLLRDLNLSLSSETHASSLPDDLFLTDDLNTPGLFLNEETSTAPASPIVLIDGPNVAMRHGNGKFSSKGIKYAIEYYLSKGYEVKAIIPEQYLNEDRGTRLKFKGGKDAKKAPDSIAVLRDLDSQGFLIKTPPWDYDDSYCIGYARDKNGIIISNDRFWDHIEDDPSIKAWIRTHTCSYTFAGDDFLPNPKFTIPRHD